VRSLKAAVEYKFVTSEQEARSALGQIYEDIYGYAGSADWTRFCAVIYMTDAFLTQAQVDAEWQLTDVPHCWEDEECALIGGGVMWMLSGGEQGSHVEIRDG
jgi:hypothetical protein